MSFLLREGWSIYGDDSGNLDFDIQILPEHGFSLRRYLTNNILDDLTNSELRSIQDIKKPEAGK